MSAEQVPPAFIDFERSAAVDLADVMALQALVRGPLVTRVLDKGRKIWLLDADPFVQGFCVMDNGSMGCRDGSVDVSLGVRLHDNDTSSGGMTLSFMQREIGSANLYEAQRNTYQLRWDRYAARGRVVVRSSMGGRARTAKLNDGRHVSDTTSVAADAKIRPMNDGDILHISHRMMDVVEAARSRRVTPRTIMHRVNYYQDIAEHSPKGVLRLVA